MIKASWPEISDLFVRRIIPGEHAGWAKWHDFLRPRQDLFHLIRFDRDVAFSLAGYPFGMPLSTWSDSVNWVSAVFAAQGAQLVALAHFSAAARKPVPGPGFGEDLVRRCAGRVHLVTDHSNEPPLGSEPQWLGKYGDHDFWTTSEACLNDFIVLAINATANSHAAAQNSQKGGTTPASLGTQ